MEEEDEEEGKEQKDRGLGGGEVHKEMEERGHRG